MADSWWHYSQLADIFADIECEERRVHRIWVPIDVRTKLKEDGHLVKGGTFWGAKVLSGKSGLIEIEGVDFNDDRDPARPPIRKTLKKP